MKDVLGQGTFGQVFRCVEQDSGAVVAVKVIKNQAAYYHQARVEVGVLQYLNTRADPEDKHHIVRMKVRNLEEIVPFFFFGMAIYQGIFATGSLRNKCQAWLRIRSSFEVLLLGLTQL